MIASVADACGHMPPLLAEALDPSTLEDGTTLQVASDAEISPVAQQATLFLSAPFDFVDSEFEPQGADGNDAPMPNEHAPKRSEDDSDARSPQRIRPTY